MNNTLHITLFLLLKLLTQPVEEPGLRPDLAVVIPLQRVESRLCHSKPAARHYIRLRAAFAIN
jgi:hypothetical protein